MKPANVKGTETMKDAADYPTFLEVIKLRWPLRPGRVHRRRVTAAAIIENEP